MSRHFRFDGTWLVDAPYDQVYERLADLEHYPLWWPEVRAIARTGDRSARVLIRSRLPYTMDLDLTATDQRPDRLESALSGALTGWARWTLTGEGQSTRVTFAQEVDVNGWLFRCAAVAARPLLVWNHEQMMRSAVRHLTDPRP
ncbi:MAG: SRPBCC family protein [Propionibacteriales bacterium]|nr:SRPBCC family protein [Propionibacteriales bacterium]